MCKEGLIDKTPDAADVARHLPLPTMSVQSLLGIALLKIVNQNIASLIV